MPAYEMSWRDVLFASYPVERRVVAPHVPDGLTVDTFDGDAWLSVVAFRNEDVRPRGVPAPLGRSMAELNLRTYVTRGGSPGVYFFSLDVDDLLGVLGARLLNHLPYYYARTVYRPGSRTRFESRRYTPGSRACRFVASYGPEGEPFRPDPDTLEHFLVERYRYFAQAQDGSIRAVDIDHEPWTLRPADWTVGEMTLFGANGFARPDRDPVLVYSHGLPVRTGAVRRPGGR